MIEGDAMLNWIWAYPFGQKHGPELGSVQACFIGQLFMGTHGNTKLIINVLELQGLVNGTMPSTWDEFDVATGQWLEHIVAEGYPKGYASDGLAALQHYVPEVASKVTQLALAEILAENGAAGASSPNQPANGGGH